MCTQPKKQACKAKQGDLVRIKPRGYERPIGPYYVVVNAGHKGAVYAREIMNGITHDEECEHYFRKSELTKIKMLRKTVRNSVIDCLTSPIPPMQFRFDADKFNDVYIAFANLGIDHLKLHCGKRIVYISFKYAMRTVDKDKNTHVTLFGVQVL